MEQQTISTISAAFAILSVVITGWISIKVEIAKMSVKILEIEKNIEKEKKINDFAFSKIDNHFEKVFDGISEIKLSLKDKADRA